MARALALTAGLLAAGCSPFGGGAFHCERSDQCNAAGKSGGICESTGFCSYADPSCPLGQRYDDHSGEHSGDCVGGNGGGDGGTGFCYGHRDGLVKPCFPAAPTGTQMLQGTIDTGTSAMCSTAVTQADGFCVIAGETIRVDGTVEVIGTKPLVLVATGAIDISATLDVASHRSAGNNPPYTTTKIGPGADPSECGTGTAPAVGTNDGGGGGGAGGTFGGTGGRGGTGGTTGADVGGAGGMAPTPSGATKLRGGCRGQSGADGTPGQGGHGGGAIYLIAETMIAVSGAINASGEGGHPGIMTGGGGGGGGSGGMIGLDSPTIMNTGVIFANGGSGGEGSGQNIRGNPGPEPAGAGPSAAPLGNVGPGGDGGTGGAGGTAGGSLDGGSGQNGGTQPVIGAGGGGGGGSGVIKLFRGTTIMGTGQHSPNPS